MNVYFLALALLQLIPTLTPVSPLTSWVPLIVILSVSAIKEAYDDWGRYQRDKATNEKLYWVVRQGEKFRVSRACAADGCAIRLPPQWPCREGDVRQNCIRVAEFWRCRNERLVACMRSLR